MQAKKGNTNFFVILAVVVLIIYGVISIITLRGKYRNLIDEEKRLQEQREAYLDEIDRLNEEIEAEMDKDYIVRIAREKLSYYLPDEILFYSDR